MSSPRRVAAALVLHALVATASAVAGCDDGPESAPAPDGGPLGDDAREGGATDASSDVDVAPGDAAGADADAGSDLADATADVDAGAPVQITFEARVGDRAFRCGDTYSGVGEPPREITPVDFRFYVHDVRVVDADGVEIPVALTKGLWQHQNVALLDFEDATASCTDGDAPKNAVVAGHVPGPFAAGGLKFRLGVPLPQNHADLSSKPAPLDKSSLFWAWQSGHIFFAAVARARLPLDAGSGVDAGTFPFNHYTHLGSVGCVGDPASGIPVTSCAKPNRPEIVLSTFDPATNKVIVDFAAVKAGTDLATKGCHADGDHCAEAYARLGIDWTSGAYTGDQSVFGVE
ncbi:MAG: metallo-mystery pair system four-Cys motif protein [Labilithrix sp.]|nr:metallo-mystery pair system four-Cys motif protein [Labilithrix sp.]